MIRCRNVTDDRLEISETTVRQLLASQFPALAELPLTKIEPGGWDNHTFRLGDTLSVRLPSAMRYSPQIGREALALSILQNQLPVAIPARLYDGHAGASYPFDWAINSWNPGRPANRIRIDPEFASRCGQLLASLHAIETPRILVPSKDNFHRGGPLTCYAHEVELSLEKLPDRSLRQALSAHWDSALASSQSTRTCWVHGDFFPWNVLVDQEGQISGLIDWGLVSTGDPACDYAIGWTCFSPEQRRELCKSSRVDVATWQRARGWSLWKAATLATGINAGPPEDIAESSAILCRIAADLD